MYLYVFMIICIKKFYFSNLEHSSNISAHIIPIFEVINLKTGSFFFNSYYFLKNTSVWQRIEFKVGKVVLNIMFCNVKLPFKSAFLKNSWDKINDHFSIFFNTVL